MRIASCPLSLGAEGDRPRERRGRRRVQLLRKGVRRQGRRRGHGHPAARRLRGSPQPAPAGRRGLRGDDLLNAPVRRLSLRYSIAPQAIIRAAGAAAIASRPQRAPARSRGGCLLRSDSGSGVPLGDPLAVILLSPGRAAARGNQLVGPDSRGRRFSPADTQQEKRAL